MPDRRILSLWFPRLGAERILRRTRGLPVAPFATLHDIANAQLLASISAEAEARGLRRGQPLRDARAMCPELVSQTRDPAAEAAFLAVLRRWATRFSPWVAEDEPEALMIELTGAAHLFGGEAAVLDAVAEDCAGFGLTVRAGLADTPGAAWALARYAGRSGQAARSGDAIEQEARATRARAARRHWTRGGALPLRIAAPPPSGRIAPPGQTRAALARLPVAALRIGAEAAAGLNRLGLRSIEDIAGLPRAALARRFGAPVLRRLDQALGLEPEPVSPAPEATRFAVRLTFPEPIGTPEDIAAGIDRLLPALGARLTTRGQGARQVRLEILCADHSRQTISIGLARPSADPARIRPLLALKIPGIAPGIGIDALRLVADVTEALRPLQHGHDTGPRADRDLAMADLIGRLGVRLGAEAVTRLAPAESHIPEKAALTLAAAWSDPVAEWPARHLPRPLVLFRPEPVAAADGPDDGPGPPARFRWRRRDFTMLRATGPERIAPEWWLDDALWRSGPRDYWRIETTGGERLWLFFAHGGAISGGWFAQGEFA